MDSSMLVSISHLAMADINSRYMTNNLFQLVELI